MKSRSPKRSSFRLRTGSWLPIILLLTVCGLGVMHVRSKKGPMMNTETYGAAHGIVKGRANELRVKDVLFRFPAEYSLEPDSAGKIVPGVADRVTLYLDLSSWFDPPPIARSEYIALVRVEIRSDGYEDVNRSAEVLATGDWNSVQDRPDLGLRQYVNRQDLGGWGDRTFESSDLRTPKGGPIIFSCAGHPGRDPGICRTRYQLPQGPVISYYLSRQLLPRWREVHADVVKKIDSFMVK